MAEDGDDRVWVIDTSSILQIRRMYDPTAPATRHQILADAGFMRSVYNHIGQLVVAGRVTFPSQVDDELYRSSSPDAAFRWTHSFVGKRRHGDPDYQVLRTVQAEIVNQFGIGEPLAESRKTSEDADPWVVAQAYELHQAGMLAAVVSEDFRDRRTTSITTACQYFGLPCIKTR